MRRALVLASVIVTTGLGVAACGSDPSSVTGAAKPVDATTSATAPSATAAPSTAAPSTNAPSTTSTGQPSAPAPTTVDSPAPGLDLTGARGYLTARGYDPADTAWSGGSTLTALVGIRKDSADGHYQRAFFFVNGRPIGYDTADPSAGIRITTSSADTVTLRYSLYSQHTALCCPDGAATVRYHWNGSHLVPLDPIPPVHDKNGVDR